MRIGWESETLYRRIHYAMPGTDKLKSTRQGFAAGI
jgi:hypothetical protein